MQNDPNLSSTFRAGALASFEAAAATLSLNLSALLRGAGLTPEALDDPEARLEPGAVAAMLEAAAVQARRGDFGLVMAQAWTLADLGPVSLALVYQETLREAVWALGRHRSHVSDAVALDIADAGDHVALRVRVALEPGVQGRQLTEFAVGTAARLCRAFLGGGWLPITASFRHGPPAENALHRRIFGRDPEYNAAFDGLVLRRSDLDIRAPRMLDPSLRQHAEALIEHLPSRQAESIADKTSRQIRSRLAQGDANLPGVAKALGLTPRTLQRRLQAEGIVFSQLLDTVRGELAKTYLIERSLPLGLIAERLGYADGSAFTRWFAEQFGEPPSRWRDRQDEQESAA
jgi:AraC-like DNA-binding protein